MKKKKRKKNFLKENINKNVTNETTEEPKLDSKSENNTDLKTQQPPVVTSSTEKEKSDKDGEELNQPNKELNEANEDILNKTVENTNGDGDKSLKNNQVESERNEKTEPDNSETIETNLVKINGVATNGFKLHNGYFDEDIHYYLVEDIKNNLGEIKLGFGNENSALKLKKTLIFTSSSYHILIQYGLPTETEKFIDNIKQILSDDNILKLQNRSKNGPVCLINADAIQLPAFILKNGNFTKNFDNITIILLIFNESSLCKKKFEITTHSLQLSVYIYIFFFFYFHPKTSKLR